MASGGACAAPQVSEGAAASVRGLKHNVSGRAVAFPIIMGLSPPFYVGRLSCCDSGESEASGRAEGKEVLPGQIMVFAALAPLCRMGAGRW